MSGFQPTPEQLAAARAGARCVETTPEQDAYLAQAQAEEDQRHADNPGWQLQSFLKDVLTRMKSLEERIESLERQAH
jgi:hypothetical protein